MLNLFNPFVLVLWVSLMGTITVGTDYVVHPRLAIAVQMASILLTLFSLDLGKVYLSDFLGRKLNLRLSFFINRYFGLLMVALGVYFAVQFVRVLWPLIETI
jgi:threonine/homoserine/homoserine lactone efflux protein